MPWNVRKGVESQMNKRNSSATFNLMQILFDICAILLAYLGADQIYRLIHKSSAMTSQLWMLCVFTIIFVLTMFLNRMYNVTTFFYYNRIILRTLGSAAVAGISITLVIFLLKLNEASRLFYISFCVLCFALVVLQRILVRMYHKTREHAKGPRVLFLGREGTYDQYRHFAGKTSMNFDFVETLTFADMRAHTQESFEQLLILNQIDEVAIDYNLENSFEYKAYMMICEDMGITVRLVMDMIDMPISQKYVSSIGTYPVVTYHSVSMNQVQMFLKSVIDVVGAFFGLVVLSPIFLLTAIAIKLESPGPGVLHTEEGGAEREGIQDLQVPLHVYGRGGPQAGADGPEQDQGRHDV